MLSHIIILLYSAYDIIVLHFIQNTNLFAIAKLLETGLCNMERINVVWKPMTSHILEARQTRSVELKYYVCVVYIRFVSVQMLLQDCMLLIH